MFIKSAKNAIDSFLSVIDEIASDTSGRFFDPKHFTRKRKLPLKDVINFVVTLGKQSIPKSISKYFLDLESKSAPVSESAMSQQRAKIKPEAFSYMFERVTESLPTVPALHDMRFLACDGSTVPIARNPEDKATFIVGKEKNKRGYNLLRLVVLYDLLAKRYVKVIVAGFHEIQERDALTRMIDEWDDFRTRICIVADRGFESFNDYQHAISKGLFFLIRVKDITSSKAMVATLDLPKEGEFDVDVSLQLCRSYIRGWQQIPGFKSIGPNGTFDVPQRAPGNCIRSISGLCGSSSRRVSMRH